MIHWSICTLHMGILRTFLDSGIGLTFDFIITIFLTHRLFKVAKTVKSDSINREILNGFSRSSTYLILDSSENTHTRDYHPPTSEKLLDIRNLAHRSRKPSWGKINFTSMTSRVLYLYTCMQDSNTSHEQSIHSIMCTSQVNFFSLSMKH